jgi:hypothetical protein
MPLIEKEKAQDSDDEAKLVQEQSNDEKTQGGAWFLHPRCSNYMTSHNLIKFDSMLLKYKSKYCFIVSTGTDAIPMQFNN